MNNLVPHLIELIRQAQRANSIELGAAVGLPPGEISHRLRMHVDRGELLLNKTIVSGRRVNAYTLPVEHKIDGIKLTLIEQRVMIAMRAAYISPTQLEERFGGYGSSAACSLLRKGLAERYEDAWVGPAFRLTEHGRAICPTRRSLAREHHSPEAEPPEEAQTHSKTAIALAYIRRHRHATSSEISSVCGCPPRAVTALLSPHVKRGEISLHKQRHRHTGRQINVYSTPEAPHAQ